MANQARSAGLIEALESRTLLSHSLHVSGAAAVGLPSDSTSLRSIKRQEPLAIIKVSPAASVLLPGKTLTLKASPQAVDGTVVALSDKLAWSSDNVSSVKVSQSGVVTAIKEGVASITAFDPATGIASVPVVVTVDGISQLQISPAANYMAPGATQTLLATATDASNKPISLTGEKLVWTTSNAGVAKVNSSGKVTAVAPGDALITLIDLTSSVSSGSFELQVEAPTAITLSPTPSTILTDLRVPLTASETDSRGNPLLMATSNHLVWNTSSAAVAAVNHEGVVHAIDLGTATVAVVDTKYNLTDSFSFSVLPIVKSIMLPKSVGTPVYSKNTITLSPTLRDKHGHIISLQTGDKLVWTSSNPAVATVDQNGIVTAQAPGGTITITVTDPLSGASASVPVTADGKISNVQLGHSGPLTFKPGEFIIVYASGVDSAGNQQDISSVAIPGLTFSVSNSSVIYLQNWGYVNDFRLYGKAAGVATVYLHYAPLNETFSLTVTISG